MRPVVYRVRCLLRARYRSTSALGLAVAVVGGVVLALAVGAARTSTAPDRYTAARGGGFDAEIQQGGGPPRTAEVAALPGAVSVESVTFLFGGLSRSGGDPAPDAIVFAGSYRAVGMGLVAGREPDPSRPGDLVASRSFVEARDIPLGTTFGLVTLSQEQADRGGFDVLATEAPGGPSVEATLVGVIDGPSELDEPTPFAVVPPPVLDEGPGVALTIMSAELRPGTSLEAFRDELDTLPDGESLGLERARLVSSELRTAVEGQAQALWLLALVAGFAAAVALGQLLTRSVRLSAEEGRRLEALGMHRLQIVTESATRAAVPVLAGTVLAVAVAVALSAGFPTGFVRRLEPDPGMRFDTSVLLLGALAFAGALVLWTVAALLLGRRPGGAERPSDLVEWVAVHCRSAAQATGVRFAFVRSGRERRSVRATVAGVTVTVTVVVGAVVFGTSLDRLVTDGSRYGLDFDLLAGTGGETLPDELVERLEADEDVAGLMLYGTGQARVGPVTLGLAGMAPVKGDMAPVVLSGRPPAADDEIGLGRLAARALGAQIGSSLTVQTEDGNRPYRVTGIVVVPPMEELKGVGEDAVVTVGGLKRAAPGATLSAATIRLRPGASPSTAERLGLGRSSEPPVIVNLRRIRSAPFALAALVAALAVLTVVHVVVTSVHHRRRDVAVLRSLGADGGWVTRAVQWQATSFTLVPLVLAVPLGLSAGRLVFGEFADRVGAVPSASFPFVVLGAVGAALVLVANAAAAVPARRARRPSPAPLLAAE